MHYITNSSNFCTVKCLNLLRAIIIEYLRVHFVLNSIYCIYIPFTLREYCVLLNHCNAKLPILTGTWYDIPQENKICGLYVIERNRR